jgi:adenine-specific DNA-methyltransferase
MEKKNLNSNIQKNTLAKYTPFLARPEILEDVRIKNLLKSVKKAFGIFFTPEPVVNFMVGLIEKQILKKEGLSILEPACGFTQFLLGIKRNYPFIIKKTKFVGVEINRDIVDYLKSLRETNNFEIIWSDYLLWETKQKFDVIICNPPYGIPSLSSHYPIKIDLATKRKYKKLYETWYGKYNVYGAFIEKSIKLLKENGQLIFINPATFMILDEFKRLRTFLAKNGETQIIYMGPDVFKPEVNVTTVVLNFKKTNKFPTTLKLLEYKNGEIYPVKDFPNWQGEIITFETEYTRKLKQLSYCLLGDLYNIRISPRTPEIKFKFRNYILRKGLKDNKEYLPILNSKNLKPFKISYKCISGYWIKKDAVTKLRKFFSFPHVVVALGFRNGGIGAAFDKKAYPWMGDVYHLLKRNDFFSKKIDLNNSELVEYLNSSYIKKYLKDTYREIVYHLSITMLKNIPIVRKKEIKKLKQIYERYSK